MKKKKNKSLLMAALILVALLGAYAGITAYNGSKTEGETVDLRQETVLFSMDPDAIVDIDVAGEQGAYRFTLKDGKWIKEDEPDTNFRQTAVQSMASYFNGAKATRIISENLENLEEYGLSNPSYVIRVKSSDGTGAILNVGMKNPSNGDYYVYTDGMPGIYTVSAVSVVPFQSQPYDMVSPEDFASLMVENMVKVEMEWNGERTVLEHKLGGSEYDPSTLSLWFVTEPFEHEFAVSNVSMEELYDDMTLLAFQDTVENNPSDERMEEYGLLAPKSYYAFEYTELAQDEVGSQPIEYYKFYIGNQDPSGDYYVIPSGGKQVYTMAKGTVEGLFDKKAEDYIYKYFSVVHVLTVDSVDITAGGTTYTLNIKNISENNSSSQTKTTTYSYQGRELLDDQAEWASNIYSSVISMVAERIEMEPGDAGGAVDFSVVFHRNRAPETFAISFTDYSTSYYLANVNGDAVYLVNKRDVNNLKEGMVKAFQALNE